MAVLGRLLVSSAERLDLPDLLSLDSYAAGDWKYFLKGLVGDSKPFILKGFDVIDPGNAIGTQSCSIRVSDSITFYPGSNSGSFFHGLQDGHPQAAPLVPELRKNAVNYVYLTFSTFNTSVDTRAFWDPDKDGGVGGEFTQDINTESVLQVQVNVSTGSFPANTIPVAKITVGPVVITAIEDARDLMFRLGSGGINPNPFNTYAWRSQPGAQYARQEPPTQMLAGGVNPFQGADKNILTLKEWMDAVMSKLRELGGTTYWYDDTSSFSIITNFYDAVATAFKSKGKWIHDLTTPGLLTWTEDIQIKMTSDPRTYILRQGSETLANEQVMYLAMQRNLPFNVTDESVSWINGQVYVNTIGGAVGLFANLSKGDYIKKANDTIDKWVRVEEFYDAVNLGGSTTTAAGARSVRLGSPYLGVTGAEKGRYDKGVYLPADVVVSDRNQAAIANTGGNFHWLALRSDTIENVGNVVTTDLSVAIDQHDGATARVTATAHGLVDGDRVTIAGTTNFDGTYQVEVETANIFYINITGGPFANESGTGHYATVTTAARSTPYGFQEESANHGFASNDTIIIEGTTNYDGSYAVNVLSATTFNIAVPGPAATETAGTATLAKIIVRTEGAVEQLIQGQSVDIGGSVADNIRLYIGMDSLSQTAPIYAIAPGYNTLDGMQNYNAAVNENLTARVSKLTAMMADKAQDKMIRALPSAGITSINNTTNGAAQEITFSPSGSSLTFMTPGSDGQAFVALPGSAPGISLLANQLAYVQIDRNDTSTPSIVVANIVDTPIDENIFLVAARLNTPDVYMWEGSIIATGGSPGPGFINTIVRQNQTLKLVAGGTWSWNGTVLTWSSGATIQVPGLANSVNSIAAGNVTLASGQVAYVDINRVGPGGALTVNVAANSSLGLTADRFIIAREDGGDVIVGNHSTRLITGESKKLYAGASNETLGAIALTSEADKGDLRILEQIGGVSKRVIISPIDSIVSDGTTWGNEISGLRMKFDGIQIDMQTGQYYGYGDGTLAGSGSLIGSAFAPAAFTSPNLFRWYSINLVADTLGSDGTMSVKPLILAGTAGTSSANAQKAPFSSKKIGQVLVQATGTGSVINNVSQSNVVQLSAGAGSGGSGASPKLIGGGTFSLSTVNGFSIGAGFNGNVYGQTVQSDGKILVSGSFTAYQGNTRNGLVRLNSDGSEDTAFYTNLGTGFTPTTIVASTTVQSDGKIIVVGNFTTLNGNTRNRVVRLNSDGTEDIAFYTNLGTAVGNGIVQQAHIQSSGQIILSGSFTLFNGATKNRLIRLSSAGVEDATFYTNTGGIYGGLFGGLAVTVQSDDKILTGGDSVQFGGTNSLRRFNSDGTPDTAFNANITTGFSGQPRGIKVQTDGKIVIVGDFTSFNSVTRNRVIRLNSDGTQDAAFNANIVAGFTSYPFGLAIQTDGKIVIAGSFNSFNGNTRQFLVRLNSDGTEDTAFYTAAITSGFVGGLVDNSTIVAIQPADGKILLGGAFTSFNGNSRNRLIRLTTTGTEDSASSGAVISFTNHIFVEQPRLNYADNRINSSVSPITLPTTNHVAFIDRLNASSGGSDLTVLVDLITNVKDGQIIIARRDGDDAVVGSTSTRLRDGESAQLFAPRSSFSNQDQTAKLIEGGTWFYNNSSTSVATTVFTSTGSGSAGFTTFPFTGLWAGSSYTTPYAFDVTSVTFQMNNIGLNATGNAIVRIYSDSAGTPNTILATSNPFNVATMTGSPQPITFTFATPFPLASGTLYHFIVVADAVTNGGSLDLIRWGSASDPNIGSAFTLNSGSSWTTNTLDLMFTINGNVLTALNRLEWSSDAFIQVPGLANVRNRIVASNLVLTNGQVAYVDINRKAGAAATLTPTIVAVGSYIQSNDRYVIARRENNTHIVGDAMLLTAGESKALYAGVSNQLLNVIPATSNADSSGQLRLLQNTSSPKRVNVSAVNKIVPDGTEYGITLKNLLLDFTGAQIDFSTGSIFKEDGTTPLGINFTPATIAAGQYRWYSVTLLPNAVTGINKISGQILVIPASADGASPALAPRAAFASSGINLGEVVVQQSGANIANIVQTAIVQLTPSGGSGGTGDANELLERLKDRLLESPFNWVQANIMSMDADAKISSATAAYDVANTVYKFSAPGQNIVSVQSLDPEFLTQGEDVDSAELVAFWNPGFIDTNAVYELSRDGGTNWQTITMSRIGTTTETFRGIFKWPADTTYALLSEWPVANATNYREINASTLQSIGQIWSVTAAQEWNAQRTILYINKVGSPVGNVLVQLIRNNAGAPSASPLDIIAQTSVSAASLAAGDNAVTVDWGTNVLPAGSYHFVISTDTAYKAGFSAGVNSVRARVDASAPLGPNTINEYDGTTWTPNAAQSLIYRIEGRNEDLRVRITSSASNVQLRGYGIFYDRQDAVISGIKNREVQQFDGTINNFNTFTITNFFPDPDLLKVYHTETGQVYLYGTNGFSLNGAQVVFPANTFNGLGTVTLVFDQLAGTSFDNSDYNASLLAANFLGSTNATIDRSQNGRGIFLRRPDGTLREITIDNSDNIVVYSV